MLHALHGAVGRHRWVVLAIWAAMVAVAIPFALQQSDRLTGGGFAVPGSESERVESAVMRGVDVNFRPPALAAVLLAPKGTPLRDYRAAANALAKAARDTPRVALDPTLRDVAIYQAEDDPGKPVVVPLTLDADEFHAPDVAKVLRKELGLADGRKYGAVQLHLVGASALWAGMVDLTKDDLAGAERVGFPIVALILIAVFASLVAALLPLLIGGVSVLITAALIAIIAKHYTMTFYVPNMASMIGLGVAVDYSLFVVVRFREELREGADRVTARATAMATSGTAVLFSGLAVVVALAGLLLVPTPAIRSMAVGAMIVVLVAMVACATLLPALLAICGRWISPGKPDPGMFRRWSERVVGRPALAAAGALVILLLLAAPVLGLRTGEGALRQFPKDNETRVGFDAARSLRGAGDITPLRVLVTPKNLGAAVKVLRADPDVVRTGVRTITKDRKWEFVVVKIKYGADDARAKTVVERLRRTLPAGSLVGGDTAAQMDFDHAITSSLWKVIVWILAATFVLLVVMLRAVPLALSAIVANLLSVAASLGVLTAAMTWGTGGTGYVDTVVIPIVIAVVFGLSMDYEVFLLSRIHERHAAGASTREAVLEGIAASGRTITGAALVMVAVFACFAVTGVPVIREIGLGAGVAIAVDATVVRLVLVPAIVVLMGDRAWWAPGRGRRRREAAVLSS